MNRKLTLLCSNVLLSNSVDDCNTENYIEIEVTNEATLKRLCNRFYLNEETNKLWEIKKDDTYLIGKIIQLRSPITCCLKEGVCKKCYGTLPNEDIHIGTLGVLILTSQLTQTLLSSKHLLKTSSEKIEFDERFLRYFFLESNIIYNKTSKKLDDASLIINKEDYLENDDDDNNKKIIRNLKIRNKNKEINLIVKKDLIISEELEELMDNKTIVEIPFKNLNGIPLFYIIIENDELSKYLNEILSLIDNNKYLEPTKERMVERINLLLDESKLKINLIHVENIIRELIRDPNNILYRPDFTKKNPDYVLIRMTEAIIKSPSVINSISFEQIKKQLYDVLTYKKKEQSFIDHQF